MHPFSLLGVAAKPGIGEWENRPLGRKLEGKARTPPRYLLRSFYRPICAIPSQLLMVVDLFLSSQALWLPQNGPVHRLLGNVTLPFRLRHTKAEVCLECLPVNFGVPPLR